MARVTVEKFCRRVQLEEFTSEIGVVAQSVKYIHSMPLESLSNSAELLDEFEKVDEPFRLGPRELYAYISAYAVARAQSINSYIWANVMHRRILVHQLRLARAVIDMETVLCPEIFERGTFLRSPKGWVERLLRDIYVHHVLNKPLKLCAKDYISDSGLDFVTYEETNCVFQDRRWSKTRPDDEVLFKHTSAYLGRVLREWFDLPGGFILQGRAQLVEVLVTKLGAGILYLPAAWDLVTSLPRFIFSNPPRIYHRCRFMKDVPYDHTSMDFFIESLESLSAEVSDASSRLHWSYMSLLRLVKTFSLQVDDARSEVYGELPYDYIYLLFVSQSNLLMDAGPDGLRSLYARRTNILQFVRDSEAVVQYIHTNNSDEQFRRSFDCKTEGVIGPSQ